MHQSTDQHCGVSLEIKFSSRWLTFHLLLKRFHSSGRSCHLPYSWRIWWCVRRVQNRSPVLFSLTGHGLPCSGLRTSPSDGPASTNASASTQEAWKCCFSLYYPDRSRKHGKHKVLFSCQRKACCSHPNFFSRSADRWVNVQFILGKNIFSMEVFQE